jgi:type VI secretion system protein ImpL
MIKLIKKLFGFLFSSTLLTILGLLVISVLIWWIGPLITIGKLAPLVSEMARIILICVLILIVVCRIFLSRWRARRASQHLTDGLMNH